MKKGLGFEDYSRVLEWAGEEAADGPLGYRGVALVVKMECGGVKLHPNTVGDARRRLEVARRAAREGAKSPEAAAAAQVAAANAAPPQRRGGVDHGTCWPQGARAPVLEGPVRPQGRRHWGAGHLHRESEGGVRLEEEGGGGGGADGAQEAEARSSRGRDPPGRRHRGEAGRRGPVDGCAAREDGRQGAHGSDCEEGRKAQWQQGGLSRPGVGTVGRLMIFDVVSFASRVLVCIEALHSTQNNAQIAFFDVRCPNLSNLYTIGLENIFWDGKILIFKRRYLGEFHSNHLKLYIGKHLLAQENTLAT